MANIVELIYNPYRNESRITVNGATISPYGEIANFLKSPFSAWYTKIIDAVARELNDDFTLVFTSGKIERMIMKAVAKQSTACTGFEEKTFDVDEGIYGRASKLWEVIAPKLGSGLSPVQCACNVFPESDSVAEEFLRQLNGEAIFVDDNGVFRLKNAGFYGINCAMYRGEAPIGSGNTINIYLRENVGEFQRTANGGPDVIILPGLVTECVSASENEYVFKVRSDEMLPMMLEIVGYLFVSPCFVQVAQYLRANVPEMETDLRIIDGVEASVKVECSCTSLEVGTSAKLKISAIPPGATIPEIEIRSLSPSVAACEGERIRAISAGHAVIEVCLKGTIKPIFRSTVEVVELNRVTAIELNASRIELGAGKSAKLEWSVTPRDAVDLSEICVSSCDESIVTVDSFGNIRAIREGECEIIVSSSKTQSVCHVCVRKNVEMINITPERITMLVGQSKELLYSAWPSDAINRDVTYMVSDPGIISFDGTVVHANSFGNATITFRNPESGVEKVCEVEVRSTLAEKNRINICKILAFPLCVVALVLMSQPGISLLFAMLGAAFAVGGIFVEKKLSENSYTLLGTKRKPELFGCIIGIIINLAVIIFSVCI